MEKNDISKLQRRAGKKEIHIEAALEVKEGIVCYSKHTKNKAIWNNIYSIQVIDFIRR